MNKILSIACGLALVLASFSCKKAETVDEVLSENLTTLFQGSFVDGSHPASGTVKLAKDASGKKFLVFENLKTDSGPDLRIWLAEDIKGTNYAEISSTYKNGTYQLTVDSSIDTDKKRKVLIWCKAFSVLFGSADLK